ncbi:MAG: DNA-formamidopyrimidine glycosylase, partial [Erysipelothrix sp.]|nr:DNA-formamidopyrimidine glycosylase [Erysipelothrix sp.]
DSRLTSSYLKKIFSHKSVPIKTVLLDQSIITGIGNIYANEILFDAKINPSTKCNQLSTIKCQKLINSTRKILDEATAMGGTTIRSYTSSLGVNGLFQQKLMVHQQSICKTCQRPITKIKINTRGTYYCQHCQK